ncbi:TPA: hypothetical protein N0F65_004123, partial [Lagenidium giganteum]
VFSLLVACLASLAVAKTPQDYEKQFEEWMARHHMSFDDIREYAKRLEVFIDNDLFIEEHNQRLGRSFTLGHNEYSHLTFDEFQSMKKGLKLPADYVEKRLAQIPQTKVNASSAPDSIDWVTKGGVTPVKNQGQCGSCWAFSTTGSVEGAVFVSSGKLVSLSEQELVDCDENGDQGCNGGLMDHAFQWIEEQGGLCSEEDYAYKAAAGVCRSCNAVAKVTGFQDVDANDEGALKLAVAQQPVSVAIEADQREFQLYRSGVFNLTCGTALDHGVLVVGYGEDHGKKFWKVKNSWGETWGEEGYIRIARDIGTPAGECGIALSASYPHATLTDYVSDPAIELPEATELINELPTIEMQDLDQELLLEQLEEMVGGAEDVIVDNEMVEEEPQSVYAYFPGGY